MSIKKRRETTKNYKKTSGQQRCPLAVGLDWRLLGLISIGYAFMLCISSIFFELIFVKPFCPKASINSDFLNHKAIWVEGKINGIFQRFNS